MYVDNQAMIMNTNGTSLTLYDYSSGGNKSFGGTLNDGQWHYVAVSYPGSGTTFYGYIDGENAPTPTVTARTPNMGTARLQIGGFNGYFDGSIDDVAIYNEALSGDQVREHYLAGGGTNRYNTRQFSKGVTTATGTASFSDLDANSPQLTM